MDRRDFVTGAAAVASTAFIPSAPAWARQDPLFAVSTPTYVSKVGLKARDGAALARWYSDVLGIRHVRSTGAVRGMGSDGHELLEIEESRSLRLDLPRTAGLYHTAFLLPSRAELARWVRHAIETRIKVDGASDHLVSEAFYLTDPEGNGVEIYADRDASAWLWDGEEVIMGSRQVDLDGLLTTLDPADLPWMDRPARAVIGHVHLRVGEVKAAEEFWHGTPSLQTVRRRDDAAVFLSSGRYHHHIAANTWQSFGAPPRDRDTTGLAFVEMAMADGPRKAVVDPWGNEVRFVAKA